MNRSSIYIGPEYNNDVSTVAFPHVTDAIVSSQSLTGERVSGTNHYDNRSQTSLLTIFKDDAVILPRSLGNEYIHHLSKISGLSAQDIQRRICVVPHHPHATYEGRILKELRRHPQKEFLPFMYDGLAKKVGDQLTNVLNVRNSRNGTTVQVMNNKLFSKKVWYEKGMTIGYTQIDLQTETKEKCLHSLLEYFNSIVDDFQRGIAIKTQMSFSGIGVVLVDTDGNLQVGDNSFTLKDFFEQQIWPNRKSFQTIFMEPSLPITEENVGSVQMYIDDAGNITPYISTQQKMHGAAHNGNTLKIEQTDPNIAAQMKIAAVNYYKVLHNYFTLNNIAPYVGDAAIDLCFLPTKKISPDTLCKMGMSSEYLQEHTIVGREGTYIMYILENNSRYGGATGVGKTQVYLQQNDMLPEGSHLEIEHMSIPSASIDLNDSDVYHNQLKVENDIIQLLDRNNLLYNPRTGKGILTATVIGGKAGKTIVMYGDDTHVPHVNQRVKSILGIKN